MRVFGKLLLAASALCLSSHADADPLKIPREELFSTVHIVGIIPTQYASNLPEATKATQLLDQKLAERMRAVGFDVRTANDYRAVEDEVRQAEGGWFDPYTGKVDPLRYNKILARARDLYQSRFRLDAVLRGNIFHQPLSFRDATRVAWDGVEENIIAKGAWKARFPDQGQVAVMTLIVGLYDRNGKLLYTAAGGIAALGALADGKTASLDIPNLLTGSTRLSEAVEIAIRPLDAGYDPSKVTPYLLKVGHLETAAKPAPTASASAPAALLSPTAIRQSIKTIAIVPIDLDGSPQSTTIQTIYQNQLSMTLQSAGYNVVSAYSYAQSWRNALEEVGGVFDPLTGKPQEEKFAHAGEIHMDTLKEQYHVDAALSASFETVDAPFDSKGMAQWDGVSRPVFAAGDMPPKLHYGAVPAISLCVRLLDMDKTSLYSRRIGVAVLARGTHLGLSERSTMVVLEDESAAGPAAKAALSGLTGNGRTEIDLHSTD